MDYENYVSSAAEVIGLPIPAEYLAGTVENFKRSAVMAAQVLAFELPIDTEPAPVFSAGEASR